MCMSDHNKFHEVADIGLAATAHAFGFPIVAVNREDERRCRFVFDDCDALHQLVEAYWRRSLAIEPQSLLGAFKAVKGRLYDGD